MPVVVKKRHLIFKKAMISRLLVNVVLTAIVCWSQSARVCKNCFCFINAGVAFCNSLNLTTLPHELEDKTLKVIDVSDNGLSSLEDDSAFSKSRATLQQLTLRNNKLTIIPESFLRNMTSLTDLDLSWNHVEMVLTTRHFNDVINLDYLSLAHNNIACFEKDAFSNLNKLTEIDLSYNNISSHCLPHKAICDLENLIVLRISHNHVPELFEESAGDRGRRVLRNTGFFSCLAKLTNLQASHCGVSSLSEHAFRGLHHLTSLDLSDNSIIHWPPGVLNDARALVYLDLGQNLLSDLPADFVASCPLLTHLSLRNNELRSIDFQWLRRFGAGTGEAESEQLDVSRAIAIMESSLQSASPGDYLTTGHRSRGSAATALWLDWSGNPWLCDCQILPFAAWVTDEGVWLNDVGGYHDLTCYDPSRHRGYALLDVYVMGLINKWTVAMLVGNCRTYSTARPVSDSSARNFNENATQVLRKSATRPVSLAEDQGSDTENFTTLASHLFPSRDKVATSFRNFDSLDRTTRTTANTTSILLLVKNHMRPSPELSSDYGFHTKTSYLDLSVTTEDQISHHEKRTKHWSVSTPAFSKSIYRADQNQQRRNFHPYVVVVSVVAEIVLSAIFLFFIRKKCKKRKNPGRWSTVVPITSEAIRSSSNIVSSDNLSIVSADA